MSKGIIFTFSIPKQQKVPINKMSYFKNAANPKKEMSRVKSPPPVKTVGTITKSTVKT